MEIILKHFFLCEKSLMRSDHFVTPSMKEQLKMQV